MLRLFLLCLTGFAAGPIHAQAYDERPLRLAVEDRLIDIASVDILRAELSETFYGDMAIHIVLAEEPAAWLATSTGLFIGMPMDLVICGELVSSPTIESPILGGSVQITGVSFENEWLERSVSILSGEATCSGAPVSTSVDTAPGTSSRSPSRPH